jgi:hypothetical protein
MRPLDTLHRAALREKRPQHPAPGDADQATLADVLRSKLAFDSLVDNLDPFDTASLLSLDLPSIVKIRETGTWRTYTTKLAGLVSEPLLFEDRADAVVEAYQELLRVIAKDRPALPWKTVRQSYLEISGMSLEVTFGRRPVFQQIGEITGEPAPCQATVRIAMVNKLTRNRANPDLVFDTLHAKIDDPRAYLVRWPGRTYRACRWQVIGWRSSARPRRRSRAASLRQTLGAPERASAAGCRQVMGQFVTSALARTGFPDKAIFSAQMHFSRPGSARPRYFRCCSSAIP